MALSLRRGGASLGAAVAFALGNPTLNIAVLVWLVFALGWQWAALRLGFGIILVLGAAALATRVRAPALALGDAEEVPLAREGAPSHWALRWVRSLVRFSVQLVPLMVVLVLLMGGARAWLFPAVGADWGNSWIAVVGLAFAGALFPIPTGGEIPILQSMMGYGLGPAPAAALLMTLAPTNLASMGMMTHAFSLRVVGVIAGVTVAVGIAAAIVAGSLAL